MRKSYLQLIGAGLLAAAFAFDTALAAPSFRVQDVGVGIPFDVNSSTTILGQDGFAPAQPWVLEAGRKTYLPLPGGATSADVARINDQGVVVGKSLNRPVVWWGQSGYMLDELPMPPGASGGAALAANAAGVVLVSYSFPVRLATGLLVTQTKPYLYTRADGLVDLSTRYTLPPYPDPVDLTDGGRILLKSGEILEPDGSVTPTPAFPPRTDGGYSWTFFTASRMNEAGAFIGVATLSSSMYYAQVVKFTPGIGWKVLGGLSTYVSANGIDDQGNALALANYVCPTNYGLVYAVAGDRPYCLDDLVPDGTWSFLSFSAKGALSSGMLLSDHTVSPRGVIAAFGYSHATGSNRLALLTPAGDLPPPPAPAIRAAAHPATYTQPYDSITVSWDLVGSLAKSYVVERKRFGESAFTEIARVSANTARHEDMSVTPLATYTYRVAALGIDGKPGPYSNEASAQAPAAKDSEAPTAAITAPAAGETVSGMVTVSASFTDNQGLVYASLSYTPNMGSEIICQNAPSAPARSLTLSCKWDSSKVAYQSPTATLYAYGYDAIGNWIRTSVSVNVTYSSSTKDGRKPPRK